MVDKIKQVIFILAYGHALIEFWRVKDLAPDPYFYLPLSSQEEGEHCAALLGSEGYSDQMLAKFGGCLRGWLKPAEMMEAFKMKVKDTVKHNGDDLLGRIVDMRGSIVHMQVDFDPSKPKPIPILQQDGEQSDKKKKADSPTPNTFENYGWSLTRRKV
jgi:hypothetical protein